VCTTLNCFSSVDVEEVSPSVGGIAGGTILTIRGKGFEKYAKSVSVEVAGILVHFVINGFQQGVH